MNPSTLFIANFPPVFFIHGVVDKVFPARFSERAHANLKLVGRMAELRFLDGQDHAFDEFLGNDNALFDTVREALDFLAKYARTGSR